jgi:Spy/CpxP family protein refolding chaperone
MRKTTRMLAAIAVAMTAAAAGASAQRGMGGRAGPDSAMGPGGPGAMMQRQLFRGITLTDSQKTQLTHLRDANRTAMQALMKSARADREALRTARENGDTVALKEARRNLEGWRNRVIALRGTMQRDVRGVLTPDQQKAFDANRVRIEQRVARAARMTHRERMWGRRHAMMRPMTPHGAWSWRGRGFGPGHGGPPNGAAPDSSKGGGPPIGG